MLSRETRLVLTASRVRLDAAAIRELDNLVREPTDWPRVLQLAIPHGTLPLMARNLRTFAGDSLPPGLLPQLEKYADRIRARNERAPGELIGILDQLGRSGVDAVPFKGPILQATYYAGEPVREFADMDLMVRPEDVARSIEVLQLMGYHTDRPHLARRLDSFLRKGDAIEFRREGRIAVDLHWRFSSAGFDFRLSPDVARRSLRTAALGGHQVSVYDARTTLMILCAHQAKHRWRRLNWLCDIAALIESCRDLDWSGALDDARENGCERIVLTTVALTGLLLGANLPAAVIGRLEQEPEARRLAENLAGRMFDSKQPPRWLYIQMREGNRFGVAGRYLKSKWLYHIG